MNIPIMQPVPGDFEPEIKCHCVNVEMGSYDNQLWVHAPAHMPKENGYCLDRCIAEEVMALWRAGITTTGCCCGHGKMHGYIGVSDNDVSRMKAMGYTVAANPCRPGDEDSFYPIGLRKLVMNLKAMEKNLNKGGCCNH